MNKLKTYKFSKLYEMSSGISSKPEQAGHGSPFVSFKTVFNNYFLPDNINEYMNVSENDKITYSVKKGDVFLTRTSESLDELAMSCVADKDYPEATYSGFLKRLRPTQNDITYDRFMAFYLRSKLFRKTMTNNAIMTLRASFNEQIFSYLNLILPEYNEQKKSGDFLYFINQKIKLNNKINAELEAMAKTLYDYWFVQFDFPDANGNPYKTSSGKMVWNEDLKREIPEGWEVMKLSLCCDIIDCLHSKKSDYYYEDKDYYLLQLENIKDDGLIDLSSKYFVSKDEYKRWTTRIEVKDHDLVITNAGRVAGLSQIPKYIVAGIGRNITAIRPKTIQPTFLYYAFQGNEMKRQIKLNTDTGTFFQSLNVRGIKELLVVRPPKYLEERFENIAIKNRRKRELNNFENQELASLRDWSLPMLMNGQVSVGGVGKDYDVNDEVLGMVAEVHTKYSKD